MSRLDDLNNAIATISEEWDELDILINNAGVVSAGLLSELSDEDIINQININITGLILLTKKSTSPFKEKQRWCHHQYFLIR